MSVFASALSVCSQQSTSEWVDMAKNDSTHLPEAKFTVRTIFSELGTSSLPCFHCFDVLALDEVQREEKGKEVVRHDGHNWCLAEKEQKH
ncbi:unnamed protein product [Sphenostylis stenocarpa]|uniref:Uncharacterized protein n=1 Tax=Sphenostylis stenocarpa TaxID=92480 RepID=A0AA86V470_9FABA|nr:unnamed protein product [Sphenostylis stenocarpa]